VNLTIVDPWTNVVDVYHEYNLKIQNQLPEDRQYDAIVLAVGHNEFLKINFEKSLKNPRVIYDVKGILSKQMVDGRL